MKDIFHSSSISERHFLTLKFARALQISDPRSSAWHMRSAPTNSTSTSSDSLFIPDTTHLNHLKRRPTRRHPAMLDRTDAGAMKSQPSFLTKKTRPALFTPSTYPTMPASSDAKEATNPGEDFRDKLTTVVTVTTRGPDLTKAPQTVTLHMEMLRDKSPVLFHHAIISTTSQVQLLDIDANAFATFAAWVYSARVDLSPKSGQQADPGDVLPAVLECYILATELGATDFANSVFDRACAISAEHGLVFSDETINSMYERTANHRGECRLRQWIVDEWVWQFDAPNVRLLSWKEDKGLPKEFLYDVVVAQAKRLGDGRKVS